VSADENEEPQDAGSYRIPSGNPWANAWKTAAALGAVGVVLVAIGWSADARRFAFSYLFAYMAILTLGLGAIFFCLIQHLTVSGWSVTVRRTAEFFAGGVPVFLILFVPLALPSTVENLYEWYGHHGDEHEEAASGEEEHEHADGESLLGASTAHAQPSGDVVHEEGTPADEADHGHGAHSTPQHALHAELLEHKSSWLAYPAWLIRALLYLLIWIGLAMFYYRNSVQQDETRDPAHTRRMQWFAPLATVLFGLSLTFAYFDWAMSLEPTWYSTIYGVYAFAGCAVSIHALVTVVTIGLKSKGLLGDAVHTEHYHDLGKMTFGFVVFWAYVGFSQMMLIWYANIPEETIYYHYRWHAEGWHGVSLFLVAGHFALPFLFLLSRNVKRRLALVGFGCIWMLVVHLVDVYWWVMPNYRRGELVMHWMDLAALLAVGGIYFAVVLYNMNRHPLIPVGDPRLPRALVHKVHNA